MAYALSLKQGMKIQLVRHTRDRVLLRWNKQNKKSKNYTRRPSMKPPVMLLVYFSWWRQNVFSDGARRKQHNRHARPPPVTAEGRNCHPPAPPERTNGRRNFTLSISALCEQFNILENFAFTRVFFVSSAIIYVYKCTYAMANRPITSEENTADVRKPIQKWKIL